MYGVRHHLVRLVGQGKQRDLPGMRPPSLYLPLHAQRVLVRGQG
jgi:hypothetical protein